MEAGGTLALEAVLSRSVGAAGSGGRVGRVFVLLVRGLALAFAITLVAFAAWRQLFLRLLHSSVMNRLSFSISRKATQLLFLVLL